MILFFDRNVGVRIPQALGLLNPPFQVKAHSELFAQDAPDDEWLAVVGKAGWIVIGFDRKFHRRPNELMALAAYEVGCFYLGGANLGTWDRFRVFLKAYDRIAEIVEDTSRPFIYRVNSRGSVKKVDVSKALAARAEAAAARDEPRGT